MYVKDLSEKSMPKIEKYRGDNFGTWAKNGSSSEKIIGNGPGVKGLLKTTKNASWTVKPSAADTIV